MNTRYTRNHYIITAIFMQLCALVYMYVMDMRVISTSGIRWTDTFGLILLVPALLLTAYGWFLTGLAILADDATFNVLNSVNTNSNLSIHRVTENDGDWKAKAVHWSTKHTTTSTDL